MAESLAIPPTLLFKLTETRGNEDRLKLIVRSLKAKFAETNDSKCVFTHPVANPAVRYFILNICSESILEITEAEAIVRLLTKRSFPII